MLFVDVRQCPGRKEVTVVLILKSSPRLDQGRRHPCQQVPMPEGQLVRAPAGCHSLQPSWVLQALASLGGLCVISSWAVEGGGAESRGMFQSSDIIYVFYGSWLPLVPASPPLSLTLLQPRRRQTS